MVKVLDKVFTKRLKNIEELITNYNQLYDYIKPLIETNDYMLDLANKLKIDVSIGLASDDIILSTTLISQNVIMESLRPKFPTKIKCHKCGEVVFDITELEKAFGDKKNEKK